MLIFTSEDQAKQMKGEKKTHLHTPFCSLEREGTTRYGVYWPCTLSFCARETQRPLKKREILQKFTLLESEAALSIDLHVDLFDVVNNYHDE